MQDYIVISYYWTKVWSNYSGGKTLFDPLLILYVCPLTNKWSVYDFNARFYMNSEETE